LGPDDGAEDPEVLLARPARLQLRERRVRVLAVDRLAVDPADAVGPALHEEVLDVAERLAGDLVHASRRVVAEELVRRDVVRSGHAAGGGRGAVAAADPWKASECDRADGYERKERQSFGQPEREPCSPHVCPSPSGNPASLGPRARPPERNRFSL